MKISQSEFIKQYCEKSGSNELSLNKLNLFAMPCDCGNERCEWWGMITMSGLLNHIEIDMTKWHEKMRDGCELKIPSRN